MTIIRGLPRLLLIVGFAVGCAGCQNAPMPGGAPVAPESAQDPAPQSPAAPPGIAGERLPRDAGYARAFIQRPGDVRKPVLLVGVWHFDYPGADAHVTVDGKKVDVLAPQRQAELDELLDSLADFAPTKVCVEAAVGSDTVRDYQAFRDGRFKLTRNEVHQIGFRLAHALNHATIFPVDQPSFLAQHASELESMPWWRAMEAPAPAAERAIAEQYDQRYRELYEYEDTLETQLSIPRMLLLLNDPERIAIGHGHYLASWIRGRDMAGADALALNWYDRNLRIFRHILELATASDDRVVVLIGAGHLALLRHCFASSPEFELVELSRVLDVSLEKR